MKYPEFFDHVPTITLYDPLSKLLGAFDDGKITYTYLDAVKLAGHSCPTVAGAYLMTLRALETLYKDETPVRGNITVTCKQLREEGVAGVIGNVIGLITGAAGEEGFKGLKGLHSRKDLLTFGKEQSVPFIFTRKDTNNSVALTYNLAAVALQEIPPQLMQIIGSSSATKGEEGHFAQIWQANVRTILEAHHHPELITITNVL